MLDPSDHIICVKTCQSSRDTVYVILTIINHVGHLRMEVYEPKEFNFATLGFVQDNPQCVEGFLHLKAEDQVIKPVCQVHPVVHWY